MNIQIWLLAIILITQIWSVIRIYGRLEEMRQCKYNAHLTLSVNKREESWTFYIKIITDIPVVIGQLADIEPHGFRVDRIQTNRDRSNTIDCEIVLDNLDSAYKYMARLIQCGWEFLSIFDEQLPEEVIKLSKEYI